MKQADLTDEDAAAIGRAFMERLPEDFMWGECPTEYVLCLQDACEDSHSIGIRAFARAILHGDEKHRAWLIDAADKFIAGEPLPATP